MITMKVLQKTNVRFALSFLVFGLVAVSFQSSADYQRKYHDLLDNCVASIRTAENPPETIKLVRKIDAGRTYKLWLDIGDEAQEATSRAYCEGRVRGGEVKVFAVAQGHWRHGHWTADTQQAIENYANTQ